MRTQNGLRIKTWKGGEDNRLSAPSLFSDSSGVSWEMQYQCNDWAYQYAWQHPVVTQAPSQNTFLTPGSPHHVHYIVFSHLLGKLTCISSLGYEILKYFQNSLPLCFLPAFPSLSCPLTLLEAERAANTHPNQWWMEALTQSQQSQKLLILKQGISRVWSFVSGLGSNRGSLEAAEAGATTESLRTWRLQWLRQQSHCCT